MKNVKNLSSMTEKFSADIVSVTNMAVSLYGAFSKMKRITKFSSQVAKERPF